MGLTTPIVVMILFLAAGCSTASSSTKTVPTNGTVYSDGSITAALAACNSSACNIKIPPGYFSFSSQFAPAAMAVLEGAGATYVNAQRECVTTLTWTGGASAPFLFSGTALQGSILRGFCLNATGTAPPVFIDVDGAAGDIDLRNVIIDTPTVAATVAAIRWGNTGFVNQAECHDVFVRDAGPIQFLLLNIDAEFKGYNCRAVTTWAGENTWKLGDIASAKRTTVLSCYSCASAAQYSNSTGIIIDDAEAVRWYDLYSEQNGSSSLAISFPSPSSHAQDIQFFGARFAGVVSAATTAIDTEATDASIQLHSPTMVGWWTNPSYLITPGNCQQISVFGADLNPSGVAFLNGSPPSSCKFSDFGSMFGRTVQPVTLPQGALAGGATPALSGTGACSTITTPVGGSWSGAFRCMGPTGASTVTITPGLTARNGWSCSGSDTADGVVGGQSAFTTTTCEIKFANVTQNDVLTFTANLF